MASSRRRHGPSRVLASLRYSLVPSGRHTTICASLGAIGSPAADLTCTGETGKSVHINQARSVCLPLSSPPAPPSARAMTASVPFFFATSGRACVLSDDRVLKPGQKLTNATFGITCAVGAGRLTACIDTGSAGRRAAIDAGARSRISAAQRNTFTVPYGCSLASVAHLAVDDVFD
jgi:hypothetical protein